MAENTTTEKSSTQVKKERRNARQRPPKENKRIENIRVGIDYPFAKWVMVQSAVGAGMYQSGAAIIREALDRVVKEYEKKNGKQQ